MDCHGDHPWKKIPISGKFYHTSILTAQLFLKYACRQQFTWIEEGCVFITLYCTNVEHCKSTLQQCWHRSFETSLCQLLSSFDLIRDRAGKPLLWRARKQACTWVDLSASGHPWVLHEISTILLKQIWVMKLPLKITVKMTAQAVIRWWSGSKPTW